MKTQSPSLRHRLTATAFAVAVFASSLPASAATFTWDGGGTSGNWAGASGTSNWNPDTTITSDNQTDLYWNTTTSGTAMAIQANRIVRSLTFDSGVTSQMRISFQNFHGGTPADLTMSAASGNASITINSGASGNIQIGAGTLGGTFGSMVLGSDLDVVHNGSGTLSFVRVVSGSMGLTKSGTGTMTFSSGTSNTYTGLTTVSGGNLNLSKTAGFDAIAGNLLINNAGTVTSTGSNQIKDTSAVEIASGGTWSLGSQNEVVGTLKLTGGVLTSSSNVAFVSSVNNIDLQSGAISMVVTGTAGATKTTSGTLTINNNFTNTGAFNINNGKVVANTFGSGDLNFASSINLGGGTVEIGSRGGSKDYTTAPLVVNAPSTLAWSNSNTFTNTLTFSGTSAFALNAPLTVQNISTDNTLVNAINLSRALSGTGALIVETYNSIASTSDNFGLGRVLLSGSNDGWSGNIQINKGTVSLSGSAVNAAGTGSITLGTTSGTAGAGLSFFPTGANNTTITYANDITVTSGGFRAIKGGNTNHNVTLTGDITLDGNLTVDHTWSTSDRRLNLNGAISGTGGLIITRAGGNAGTTLRIGGTNNYTGDTIVSSGASLSIAGSLTSDISVATGARIGGDGSTTGDLSLASGANFIFTITSTFDVSGSVTLDGSFGIASLVGGSQGEAVDWSLVPEGTYTLIGSTASTFNHITNFGEANKVEVIAGKYAYFQNGSLQLVVVPEPSTALLLVGSMGMLTLLRRRVR